MMSKKKTPQMEDPVEETVETAAEAAETEAPEEPAEGTASETPDEGLQAKFDDLNNRFLRMAAEYENFRKRSQREREGVHADAVAYAVGALLPTVDNLERALKAETADAEYKKGVEMTMAGLMKALEGLGVTQIDAAGRPFDPNVHNAVMHIEDESFGENTVAEVFQAGFMLGEKVIRFAMVKVAN